MQIALLIVEVQHFDQTIISGLMNSQARQQKYRVAKNCALCSQIGERNEMHRSVIDIYPEIRFAAMAIPS